MFPAIGFLSATTAIVIILMCYILFIVKLETASDLSEFSNLLQETYEDLSIRRRMEMLETIKEMKVEKVTLQFLREMEIFSDTEGKYVFDLAKKLTHLAAIIEPIKEES